jgi:hypothetical protein
MTPRRFALTILLAICLLPVLLFGWAFWHGYPGNLIAPNHQLVVRDYLNLWAGGRLAAQGHIAVIFDPQAYATWLRSIFGPRLDLHTWSYPPHFLLLAFPFGWLPLIPGFLVWTAATGALLWFVLRTGGLSVWCTLASLLSPAGLENALGGQNGALTTAGLAGGLLLCEQRPVLAGALLGLLTFKPQLGLLVPICLLARRDWRSLGWAAVFGTAYCAAGLLAFGWETWRQYFTVTTPFMRGYMDARFGLTGHYMMATPFITMRAAGADLGASYAVQAVVSVLCAMLAWWAWSRRAADDRVLVALVLCLAPLATPYAHSYDLIGAAVACVMLVTEADEQRALRPRDWLRLGLLLGPAWLWPGGALVSGLLIAPGLAPFCIAPAVGLAGWYIARGGLAGAPHLVSTPAGRAAVDPIKPRQR